MQTLARLDGYRRGIQSEQQRIIEILEALPAEFVRKDEIERAVAVAIKRIKEQKLGF